jgi:hypothetical protein
MTQTTFFNLSQPIVYVNGTMQPPFADFIRQVDLAINDAALTAQWGLLGGTLSDQSDLQGELDAKITSDDLNTLAELNTQITDATLITDAVSDGSSYARNNGAWLALNTNKSADGGFANSVYTAAQSIDGGTA